MPGEFDVIGRYFKRAAPAAYLGVGDDCALLPVAPGYQLAASTDLLLEGRHFLPGTDPQALGHKALAVNLSDLAAMGAQPLGCLLGLSVPTVDQAWLAGFSEGLHALAQQACCPLLGGDTTRSLAGIVISITVLGQVRPEQALRRDAAQPGDDIWLTGTLGAAHIALQLLLGHMGPDPDLLQATRPALERPMPPWRMGQALAGLAHAALDVSDGLLQDLNHILVASGCGARLDYTALPVDAALLGLPEAMRLEAVLSGGDVYQLCFTAAPRQRESILALAREHALRVSRVGAITAEAGLRVLGPEGELKLPRQPGYDHFGADGATFT